MPPLYPRTSKPRDVPLPWIEGVRSVAATIYSIRHTGKGGTEAQLVLCTALSTQRAWDAWFTVIVVAELTVFRLRPRLVPTGTVDMQYRSASSTVSTVGSNTRSLTRCTSHSLFVYANCGAAGIESRLALHRTPSKALPMLLVPLVRRQYSNHHIAQHRSKLVRVTAEQSTHPVQQSNSERASESTGPAAALTVVC